MTVPTIRPFSVSKTMQRSISLFRTLDRGYR